MKTTINGITYESFPKGKTISELGIDTTRKFIVLDGLAFNEGDIITLYNDDNSDTPYFEDINGNVYSKSLYNIAYYEEFTKGELIEVLTPSGEWVKKKFISYIPDTDRVLVTGRGNSLEGDFPILIYKKYRKLETKSERKIKATDAQWEEIQKLLKLK